MKFLKSIVALALVLTFVLSICATAQAAYHRMYVNVPAGQTVNMRSSPSSSATIVIRIPSGAAVQAELYDTSWYKVQYGQYSGYVLSAYLSSSKPLANNDVMFDSLPQ